MNDIPTLRRILNQNRVIAMVGLSANWYRPSYFAAKYMQDHGYRIIPVNPKYDEVLRERCYPDLAAIPESIDIVDCFRQPEEMVPLARQAAAIGAKVLWMQLGIRNDEAAKLAEASGLKVVMNRCPKIEYGRLSSEISWMGVNSRTLSSKRAPIPTQGMRLSLNRTSVSGGATAASDRAAKNKSEST